MGVSPIIVVLFLQCVYGADIKEKQTCNLRQLYKLTELKCFDGGSEMTSRKSDSFVNTGTSCSYQDHDGIGTRTCYGGLWLTKQELASLNVPNRRSKRFILGSVIHFVGCLFSDCSPKDRTRPTLHCPPPQILDADPIQTNKKHVTWRRATATDDKDGSRSTTLHGKVPGSTFGEGTNTITYDARDRSGNRGYCSFTITVKVYRCPPPTRIDNGYYICHPSADFVQGTNCVFGCYDGFELDLPHVTSKTCLKTEQWDNAQPVCKPFKCPPLPPVDGATYHCTNNLYFRSICTYQCKTGYAMPPGVSATLVCAINKQWRSYGKPRCVDIIRPTFDHCPSIIVVGTDNAVTTAKASWVPPTVDDNSNGKVDRRQIVGRAPGSQLKAGTYTIEYEAEDEAGNMAMPCRFKVIVRDVRCPRLYRTPYTNFHCPHGYRSGVLCNIACDPGKELDGATFVTCEQSKQGLYGEWNWNGDQTRCKSTSNCLPIPAPKNGAVACDTWIGGNFCQMQCRNGTYIHSDIGWKQVHTCTRKGDWTPPVGRGPCKKPTSHATSSLAMSAHFHFEGDCSNANVKLEIQNNFVSALNGSLYGDPVCKAQAGMCRAGNVQVRCGQSDRRKRSGAFGNTTEPSVSNTTATTTNVSISFQVSITSPDSLSMDDTVLQYTGMFTDLQKTLSSSAIQLAKGGVMLELDTMENSGLALTCPRGSVVSKQSVSCMECPEGTYYDEGQSICQECPKATYQDLTGQMRCLSCPSTTTTRSTGGVDQSFCEDACEPGTRSATGVVPCSFCEVGTYSTGYGNQQCAKCPGSTSTLTEGMDNVAECKEFDIVCTPGETSYVHIGVQESLNLTDLFVTFWIQSLNVTSSNFTLRLRDDDNGTSLMLQQTSQQLMLEQAGLEYHIVGAATPDARWHFVEVTRQACTVNVTIDGVTLLSEARACDTIRLHTVSMSTEASFEGRLSQFNIWSPQQYEAIKPQMTCFHQDTGAVLSWQDFSDAHMDGAYVELDSVCDDYDNCASSPCMNGTCSDVVHGFTCACADGFTGSTCSDNIDDCQANMCINGGSCVDGLSVYTCACLPTYTGKYCEIEMVHGQWGEWSNYTDCSSTCGPGTKRRRRLCDSPAPDNGGHVCPGNDTDVSDCNQEECPICPELVAPDHVSLSCMNHSDSLTCTISCDPGYEFDTPPLDTYYCGPDTFHVWSFETAENPLRRLPQCTQMHPPSQITVTYQAQYKDWACADENEVLIRAKVNNVLAQLQCVQNGTCTVTSITANLCNSGDRQKRSAAVSSFVVTLNTKPKDMDGSGTLFGLQGAIGTLQAAAEGGEMTVVYNGKTYVIDIHSTVGGDVTCGPGYIKAYHYCVACGKGSYMSIDHCERCDFGTYQDQEGQLGCTSCPEGTSTLGLGSVNYTDCTVSVAVNKDSETLMVGLLAGCLTGGFVIVAVMVAFFIRKMTTKKIHSDNIADQYSIYSLPRREPDIQANVKFDAKQLYLRREESGL